MTTLLITGANGFVGQALCERAIRQGFHVKGAVRTACSLPLGVDRVVAGTVDGGTAWADALQGVDVIVHLAARVHVMKDSSTDPLAEFRKVNVAGTENLARQAVQAGVKRLIYVSSIKVNGEEAEAGQRYTELDAPAPSDPYGISKWEAEQALHRIACKTGLEVAILRPPLVYGAGVKGNFAQMLNVLAKGIPLPFASVRNLRSLVYVGNLADALITCATHPAAAGQTYLVGDGEDISTPDLLCCLGVAISHPAKLIPCPVSLLRLAGKITGKSKQMDRLLGSLQVDSNKIRRDLNWAPPYSLQQGLQATAEWWKAAQQSTPK